jgi:hypothetical protein
MEEMRIKGTRVAIPSLNPTQVKFLMILIPTSEIAGTFHTLVEPWIARMLAACNESPTLAALHDALLPTLISGELHLADVGRSVTSTPGAPGKEGS